MDIIELLNNYSKEKHLKELYTDYPVIDFKVKPIFSSNWSDPTWLSASKIPYVALTNMVDSYDCLPERPDMAFTHLWKSINNIYIEIAKKDKLNKIQQNIANSIILSNKDQKSLSELSDSLGITYLVNGINQKCNDVIKDDITVIKLLNQYLQILPDKTLRFISNTILKGYVIEESGFPSLVNSSSYFSFKKKYESIFIPIVKTYGESYLKLATPILNGNSVELNINDEPKSRLIPLSLTSKLKELILTKNTTVKSSDGNDTYILRLNSDSDVIDFALRIILYSIRNNSVHGNLVSRLNSEFQNRDSLKTSIYIYFLGHLILSLGLYVNGDINLDDLKINITNLNTLKSIK